MFDFGIIGTCTCIIPGVSRSIPVACIRVGQGTAAIDIVNDGTAFYADAHVTCDVGLATAAIDVMAYRSTFHDDRSAAIDNSRRTETTAIDVGAHRTAV